MLIKGHSDVKQFKAEVRLRNLIIARISQLANDSVKDVIIAVNEFCKFVKGIDDDTFFQSEKRLMITPQGTCVWRRIEERYEAVTSSEVFLR